MKVINISVLTDKIIRLGRRGEGNVRQIVFDCTCFAETYGSGTAQLLHWRRGDEAPYPVLIEQNDNIVTWTVQESDTANVGIGEAEIIWMLPDGNAKSAVYETETLRSLSEPGDPPEPWQAWVDEVLKAAESGGATPEQIAGAVERYLAEHPIEETDPTVPEWAKQPEKPSYTASEVGADATGTAESKVSDHNTRTDTHNDIRILIKSLTARLNALADSDDNTLDQMSEVVAYIKSNKSLIDAITTSKINVSDIIDNLTTNVSNKPLSSAQGVALKALIDAIPTVELDETLTDNTKAAPAGMVGELKSELTNLKKIVEALQESMGQIYGNIILSETTISMDEGTSVIFTVSLDKAPSENQTVKITTKGNYVTVSPSTLTFTSDNYNVAQTVTVSSIDDENEGDKQETITLTSAYKTAQISITIVNNDVSIEWHTVTLDEVSGINSTNYLMSRYSGSEINVLIPETLNDKTVQMNVANNANFDANNIIENIKFENGVLGSFKNGNSSYLTSLKGVYGIGSLTSFEMGGNVSLEKVIITSDNENCTSFSLNKATAAKNVAGLGHLTALESMEQSLAGTAIMSIESYPPNLKNTKLMFWRCEQLESVPDISMELTTWTNMFLGCNALTEVSVSAMTGCGVDLIGYDAGRGTGWTGDNFTFKCNYGSDMYSSFRSMICDSIGSSEQLYIETLDSTENPITNIVMWGDSMTRAGNKTMGNVPEQLAELVSNDVMIWNYGYSGNTIQTAGTRFDNHSEKHGDVSVIWLGTNNTSLSGEEMTALIQSTFINKLITDKYIVVGLLTTNYSDEKNQAFADAFGVHFLNIREYFLENMWTVSALTATEQDNADLLNNLIPTSFRYDATHLNPNGGKVVATAIKDKLLSMGYITSEQIAS